MGFSYLFVFPMILTNPSIYVCSCPAIVLLCDSIVTMFLPTTTCRSHSYVSSDYLVLLCFIRVSATYSHTERWYFAFLFRAGAHFGFCLFLHGFPRVHLLDCDRCYDFIRFAEVHFTRLLFVFSYFPRYSPGEYVGFPVFRGGVRMLTLT